MDALRSVEKGAFHMTINYFWIQMVKYCIAVVQQRLRKSNKDVAPSVNSSMMVFDEWYRQPECQRLRNQLLHGKYYTARALDAPRAAVEFVLPDLKTLPSLVPQ